MKTLTLIRHAKSNHDDPSLSDIQRPLNQRGRDSATRMGQVLKSQQFEFDELFCSPANRATQTAELLCEALGLPVATARIEPGLYTFDMEDLYRFIEQIDDRIEHAVILSHNPGITLLANDLALSSLDNIPTCGIVKLQLDVAHWVAINTGSARLLEFDFPKNHADQ